MHHLRAYLRTDLLVWRWVFLALYLVVVGISFTILWTEVDEELALVMLGSMIAAQCLFIFGAGTMSLSRPMKRRRLIWPALVSGFMAGLLVLGFLLAMGELSTPLLDRIPAAGWANFIITAILVFGLPVVTWIAWSVLFFQRYRYQPRKSALWAMSKWLLAGSLLELMACVPAHLIVSRRTSYCFVGVLTMIGIVAGISVMLFAFGPGLVLLFLRPRYRKELAAARVTGEHYCTTCGYDLRASIGRCPECGTMF